MKLLFSFLLASTALNQVQGVEPIVATPFDIRHSATEVLEDIHLMRGDAGVILQRAQGLLAAHGESMFVQDGVCAPIFEHIGLALKHKQLTDLFVQTYSGIAERRLREALSVRASEEDIRVIALSYPGTPSALKAWQYLANNAWDTGRIGLYLHYARCTQENADASGTERYQVAYSLLHPARSYVLPESLDELTEMWHIDLDAANTVTTSAPLINNRVGSSRIQNAIIKRYALSLPANEMIAASDGRRFFLFDHLIGRVIGDVNPLGDMIMAPELSRPVATDDGFIAIGRAANHAVLLALNQLGDVKWRINSPDIGSLRAISGLIVLDNVVAFAALSFDKANVIDLRVLAYHITTGKLAWNTLITSIPVSRQMMWSSSRYGMAPPTITVHDGSIIVLSNNGIIARLACDGNVNRLWSYETVVEEFIDGSGNYSQGSRLGAIMSDGHLLAASPVDSSGIILMLGHDDAAPRIFQGDGAQGDVLDVRDGKALLGGVRNLAMLNLTTGKTDWTFPFSTDQENVQGKIGTKAVMIGTNEKLMLIERDSGHVISSRGIEQGMSLGLTSDFVIAATNDLLISWGRGESFLERFTTAADLKPKDYRPWGAIASYYDARGEQQKAFVSFIEALQRGAPVYYAERAARLVREQIQLSVGHGEVFKESMEKLQTLAAYYNRLSGEVSFWLARDAELRGNKEQAFARYSKVLKEPDHRLLLKDRIEISMHTLARAGLVRIENLVHPVAKLVAEPTDTPFALMPNKPWQLQGSLGKSTIIVGEKLFGFRSGFLSAFNLSDGSELWQRKPIHQILGISANINFSVEHPDGLRISQVVQGSSAAGAGMRSGDVMVSFQGQKTTNYERDVRGVLAKMEPSMPFIMSVKRGNDVLDLKGVLGGEPMEPVAANNRTVLAWLTSSLFNTHLEKKITIPDDIWFSVMDAETGQVRFRYPFQAVNNKSVKTQQPLLTKNNLILTQEAFNLVCIPADTPVPGQVPDPLWKLPLGENGMSQLRLLTDDLLWLPQEGHNRIHIVDIITGKIIYVLPEDRTADSILEQNSCYCLGLAGHLTSWDLGVGQMRWKTDKVYGRLYAVSGDAVFVSDDQNQLVVLDAANGKERLRYDEWSNLENVICDKGHLCLCVRRADRSQALVRVSLHTGHIVWQQTLPPDFEVNQLVTTHEAFGALLSEKSGTKALLMINNKGVIQTACQLEDNDSLLPATGAVLCAGDTGIRVAPMLTTEKMEPVAVQNFPKENKLSVLYKNQHDKLQWQSIGAGAYTMGNQNGALVIFAQLGDDESQLNLRIADGEDPIDTVGQMIAFTPTQPLFMGGGAWTVDQVEKITDSEKPILLGIRLLPTPKRAANTRLSVMGQYGENSEAPNSPWWLRLKWRAVVGGP